MYNTSSIERCLSLISTTVDDAKYFSGEDIIKSFKKLNIEDFYDYGITNSNELMDFKVKYVITGFIKRGMNYALMNDPTNVLVCIRQRSQFVYV